MPGFCDALETGHFFVDERAVFCVEYFKTWFEKSHTMSLGGTGNPTLRDKAVV